MDWTRFARFFRLSGALPGIRYDARVVVLDLQDLPAAPAGPALDRTGLQTDLSALAPGPLSAHAAEPAEPRNDG